MSEEAFNMALRKFLKQVGVTSQREIEKAVRSGKVSDGPMKVTMTLTDETGTLKHSVDGVIELP